MSSKVVITTETISTHVHKATIIFDGKEASEEYTSDEWAKRCAAIMRLVSRILINEKKYNVSAESILNTSKHVLMKTIQTCAEYHN